MSYANLLLYGSTLPSYDNLKGKGASVGSGEDDVVRADDPANRENVLAIIRGQKFD